MTGRERTLALMVTTKTNKTRRGERVAYTFAEFAALFGRERTWVYRLADKNKVRVIRGYGKALIPASEVERILEGGAQ